MRDSILDHIEHRWWQLQRWRTSPRHLRTYPNCVRHRAPRTPWGRWHYDTMRGAGCPVCAPPRVYLARERINE